jgi:hypothetical protein
MVFGHLSMLRTRTSLVVCNAPGFMLPYGRPAAGGWLPPSCIGCRHGTDGDPEPGSGARLGRPDHPAHGAAKLALFAR